MNFSSSISFLLSLNCLSYLNKSSFFSSYISSHKTFAILFSNYTALSTKLLRSFITEALVSLIYSFVFTLSSMTYFPKTSSLLNLVILLNFQKYYFIVCEFSFMQLRNAFLCKSLLIVLGSSLTNYILSFLLS